MTIRTLNVDLGTRGYPIRIGAGLLTDPASFSMLRGRQVLVVTDENVAHHHLGSVSKSIGIEDKRILVLPAGEAQKTWDNAGKVLDWMLEARLSRDAALVALGGGVIGDLVGFCAAVYQRGIDFLQIPTTLLSQVDSSVGGKTAVNNVRGKNLIGAFHQPIAVVSDTATLESLPARELRAGLAEVIKYGMLADQVMFGWLERNLDRIVALESQFIAETVERCCSIKARIVGLDERESMGGGPRALLNLGHTFGHAIEAHTGYTEWLHGEAIAVGLCMAADLSHRLGWLRSVDVERVNHLISRVGLPTTVPSGMSPQVFRELMGLDKKVKDGKLRLVLMRAVGEAVLSSDFDDNMLNETLEKFCSQGPALAILDSI